MWARQAFTFRFFLLTHPSGRRRLSHKATLAALLIFLYRDEPLLQAPYRFLSLAQDIDEVRFPYVVTTQHTFITHTHTYIHHAHTHTRTHTHTQTQTYTHNMIHNILHHVSSLHFM